MATAAEIKAVFVRDAALITGVKNVVDHEPQALPQLPCVTLLANQWDPVAAGTGGAEDITYGWIVHLYVPLQDAKKAQDLLDELIPGLLGVVRDNPRLDDTADIVQIRDDGEEPHPVTSGSGGNAAFLKRLRLTARTTF